MALRSWDLWGIISKPQLHPHPLQAMFVQMLLQNHMFRIRWQKNLRLSILCSQAAQSQGQRLHSVP